MYRMSGDAFYWSDHRIRVLTSLTMGSWVCEAMGYFLELLDGAAWSRLAITVEVSAGVMYWLRMELMGFWQIWGLDI